MSPADIKTQTTVNGQTVDVTTNPQPSFVGVTEPGVTITVHEFQQQVNGNYIPYGTTFTTTSDPPTVVQLPVPEPECDAGDVPGLRHGILHELPQYPGEPVQSKTVTFEIVSNTTPAAVSDFRLNPADDTGIVGDNITGDHTPNFIGTTRSGQYRRAVPGRQPRRREHG